MTSLLAGPEASERPATAETGLLTDQAIRGFVRNKQIQSVVPIESDQVQPASLDLRLGPTAYRVRTSFLPGAGILVRDRLSRYGMHEIDLAAGAVLEKGCVYVVPLAEHVHLPSRVRAFGNPKSSTGRLDVFTRLITDGGAVFDEVPAGYRGPLFAEIAPRTFSIKVREGSRLCQLRIRRGSPPTSGAQISRLQREHGLVTASAGEAVIREDRIGVTLDLEPDPAGLIGFRARKHADVVDVDQRDAYDPTEFWEPIAPHKGGGIVLDPNDFHILATRERISVPPDHAAEMVAYDTLVGEFRVHYAGFFDPGFGYGDGAAAKAVLEVRSHDVPFLLEHGQVIGWLRYERLIGVPARIYGSEIGSSYQGQALKLGKQFKAWPGRHGCV